MCQTYQVPLGSDLLQTAKQISIIATFGVLYFNDISLNQMSFGGLALGIGLIVDNSIVVLENMVRIREQGHSLKESALTGTRQVTGAIIASTLTTSVIFLPVFMNTISGMLFQELALVVVFALLCTLFVALTLVPMLGSRYLTVNGNGGNGENGELRKSRTARWTETLEAFYVKQIERAIKHKNMVFIVTGVVLVITIFLWRLLPVELAPQTDANEIDIELEMAQGTNIAVVNEYLKEMDSIVRGIVPMDQVEHLSMEIRSSMAEFPPNPPSATPPLKSRRTKIPSPKPLPFCQPAGRHGFFRTAAGPKHF